MELTAWDWAKLAACSLALIGVLWMVWLACCETWRACTVGSGEESPIARAGQAAAWSLVPLAVDHATQGETLDGGWSGGFDDGGSDGD